VPTVCMIMMFSRKILLTGKNRVDVRGDVVWDACVFYSCAKARGILFRGESNSTRGKSRLSVRVSCEQVLTELGLPCCHFA
jgi:hypothetical protein